MRDLQQHAGAVARLGIGADGAAMFEVSQDAQAVGDDLVALDVLDVGDEADAAGIMLAGGVDRARRAREGRMGGTGYRQVRTCLWSPHLDPGLALLKEAQDQAILNGFSELFVQWAAELSNFGRRRRAGRQ